MSSPKKFRIKKKPKAPVFERSIVPLPLVIPYGINTVDDVLQTIVDGYSKLRHLSIENKIENLDYPEFTKSELFSRSHFELDYDGFLELFVSLDLSNQEKERRMNEYQKKLAVWQEWYDQHKEKVDEVLTEREILRVLKKERQLQLKRDQEISTLQKQLDRIRGEIEKLNKTE